MTNQKHPLAALAVYGVVAFTLMGGIGLGVAAIATTAVVSSPSVQDKTALQLRIESAREVREALAKPVPAPAPLPPITAKLERPVPKVAARPAPQRNPEYAMRQARQAFASIDGPPPQPQSFFSFLGFDRHTR